MIVDGSQAVKRVTGNVKIMFTLHEMLLFKTGENICNNCNQLSPAGIGNHSYLRSKEKYEKLEEAWALV